MRSEWKIPDGLSREDILRAAEDYDGGVKHAFADSTKFDVVIRDRRFPPKAIVGIASRTSTGVEVLPKDFTGGLGSKCFRILKELGFEIVPKDLFAATPTFVHGRVYRRKEIHDSIGGQRQGGISTPKQYPVILLFSAPSGEDFGYQDGWTDAGVYQYTGEGQEGDMKFTKGNLAIRDHMSNGESLFLFESLGRRGYRYTGEFTCASWTNVSGSDVNGKERQTIVFHLVPTSASDDLTEDTDTSPTLATLDELRERAFDAAEKTPMAANGDVVRIAYRRSKAVKDYVLARAGGRCELCTKIAPFKRPDGTWYLEPHHTKRVSDGGPDHPRFVAALCVRRRFKTGHSWALQNRPVHVG